MSEPGNQATQKAEDFLTPASFIRAAKTAHPAFRYALAIAGILAIVVTFVKFGVGYVTLVFGGIALIGLMVLFLVFAQASKLTKSTLDLPAQVLVWAILLVAIVIVIFLTSSVFFNKPLPFRDWIVHELASVATPGPSGSAASPSGPVPVTLTAVYRDSLIPASQTIFTIFDPKSHAIHQEVKPDSNGKATFELVPGNYELQALGASENLNFEVTAPQTLITVQVAPTGLGSVEASMASESLVISVGSSKSAFDNQILISVIGSAMAGNPPSRKVSFTVGISGGKSHTYALQDVGSAAQVDGFEVRLSDVTDWGARFLIQDRRTNTTIRSTGPQDSAADKNGTQYDGKAAVELARQLRAQGVRYTWGGRSPQSGMDSSGFVGYILHRQGLLGSVWPRVTSQTLPGALAANHSRTYMFRPEILDAGDLIFVSNYVFIFEGGSRKAIGMTGGTVRSVSSAIEEIDIDTDLEPLYNACMGVNVGERPRCEILYVRP